MGTISNIAQALAHAQIAVHYLEQDKHDVIGVSVDVYAQGFRPAVHIANTAKLQMAIEQGELRNVQIKDRQASINVHGCRVYWMV